MEEELYFQFNLQFFAKDGEGGEKTEQPTDKKKNDTRDEGRVAKSKELSSALDLIALFLVMKLFVSMVSGRFMDIFRWSFNMIPDFLDNNKVTVTSAAVSGVMSECIKDILLTLMPFLIASVAIAIGSNMLQFKFKVTTKPLQPKLSKFNPINGFKRMFSKQKLFDLALSIVKIALIFLVAYITIKKQANSLFLLYDMPLFQAIGLVGGIILDVGLRISLIYLIIGIVDLIYQRYKFNDDLKMTKQEVKDEYKNTEGDPQVKGQQKARMREASRRRMMQQVPQADVVITNPTHLSVALKYDSFSGRAPVVVAKGEDYVALKIREVAREHNIEIVENKPLARALYATVDLDQEIPQELYQSVAEILADIYKARGDVSGQTA